jgi:SAM-dependent methyltransferase
MDDKPWQLQIIDKSLKKKEKLRYLTAGLHPGPASVALDLGCAQGMLSYFLRRRGGFWVSADQDFTNLLTARGLVETDLVQVEAASLPFGSRTFDLVALPDYLEHVADDVGLLSELSRVLKPGGALIVVVPQTGKFHLLHRLKSALGMKLEFYGHKREGYRVADLAGKLEGAGFRLTAHKSYAKFFSELFELVLNLFYIRLYGDETAESLRDGHIRPTTADEFSSRRGAFNLYSLVYPFVWLTSQLDRLLFFQEGNSLIVWARRR